MTPRSIALGAAVLLSVSGLAACGNAPDDAASSVASRLPPGGHATTDEPFEPIPQQVSLDPRRVELGRRLFEDPALSGSGERACVDCHDLGAGGIVPGEARSNHPRNATGPYNVPTVFNVAYNFRFNWNGKFETLEGHLSGPMMRPEVMDAGSWDDVVGRIRDSYRDDFAEAGYEGGVTEDNVRHALATYERALITPNSRFDRYLRGEIELTEREARGYELFKTVGCKTCHQGINVGGNLFQRFGVVEDAFEGRPITERDMGRYLVTGDEDDAHVFRVPSLRNVEVTAPYFHDGSAETLEEAVEHMGRVQLGYLLTDEEVKDIVAFLRTLTGTLHGTSLAKDRGG
ncbi:MAG: cytochrome-c peroxidase [Polyangiales bacterium]